ncbi:MAG: hypothetical protein ACREAC_33005, partial [Blastocatellia bacterium]
MLLAADTLSDTTIADQLGISRRTLANWKGEPAFADHVRLRKKSKELVRNTARARRGPYFIPWQSKG